MTTSPGSLVFSTCETNQAVTFTATAAGDYVITVTVVDTGEAPGPPAPYNTSPATFTLHVLAPPTDTTPPVITVDVTGTLGSNGWYIDDVFVDWTYDDPDSAFAVDFGCVDTTIDYDTTGETLECQVTSDGGTSYESVTIKRDATAPSVTVTPERAPDYNGWYNVSVTFDVDGTDATSGIDSCDDDIVYSSPDGSGLTVYGECTDNAGNVGSAYSAPFDYDGTAPTVTVTADRAPDHNGWYNAPVTFDTAGSDGGSGVDDADCTTDQLYSGPDGIGLIVYGQCTDGAGNVGYGQSDPFGYDATAPSVTVTPDRAPDHNGWYNAPVTFDVEGADATSGIAYCDADIEYGGPDGTGLTVDGECTDNAGNVGSGVSDPFDFDDTDPVVTVTGVTDGAQYSFGTEPEAGCDTDDLTSGVATPATVSVSGGNDYGIGEFTATCSGAEDNAGNEAGDVSVTYHVIYNWSGFFQPIDNNALNTVKAGSAVPVKFSLGGYFGLDIFETGYPRSVSMTCGGGLADEIEETVTAGQSSLSYDPDTDQYVHVWKTLSSYKGTCRQLQVLLNDGTAVHTADFKFR